MNAIDFLLKEHEKVRAILAEISDTSHRDATRKQMFDELCTMLLRHEAMEHKVWYPYFKNNDKLDDTVKHLIAEEKHAEKAIKSFDNIKTQEAWEERFAKFKKDVEHHAQEEETKLFPKITKVLDEATLKQIGKEMFHFKQTH